MKRTRDELFEEMKIDLGIDKYERTPDWICDLIERLLDYGWVKKWNEKRLWLKDVLIVLFVNHKLIKEVKNDRTHRDFWGLLMLRIARNFEVNEPYISRFFERITKTNSCWNWKGKLNNTGYGQIKIGNVGNLAYRYSYKLKNGGITQ